MLDVDPVLIRGLLSSRIILKIRLAYSHLLLILLIASSISKALLTLKHVAKSFQGLVHHNACAKLIHTHILDDFFAT